MPRRHPCDCDRSDDRRGDGLDHVRPITTSIFLPAAPAPPPVTVPVPDIATVNKRSKRKRLSAA